AIDDVANSNNVLGMPRVVRAILARRERSWARAADARITVNDDLAARLADAWRTKRPAVVPNWPELTDDVTAQPDRIRDALRLPSTTRIVLFQGRLGPNLGLDALAQAVLEVPDAALCLIGFGRGFGASVARDSDPRFGGRHHTLPAVHPDEIVSWTASADVCVIPLPPVSANQRASTPNKFWEAIAAGTPVVIGPGLPAMRRVVVEHDLGVVARSLDPGDLAAAIVAVLDVAPTAAAERRARIRLIASERYAWRVAARRYRDVVAEIAGDAAPADVEPADAGTSRLWRDRLRPVLGPFVRPARRGVGFVRVRVAWRRQAREHAAFVARRAAAAAAGRIVRVLLYSPANLNVVDGSSVWVESVAATLSAGSEVWPVVPLKAHERRRLITDSLRRLPRVEVLPVEIFRRRVDRPLEIESMLDWIERLDEEEPFDLLLLRGYEVCDAALARDRFRGRVWSTYILEPERDPDSAPYRTAMGMIAEASAWVVSQSDEMRIATEDRVPAARGRTILLPPAIPSSVPRADPDRVVPRLLYTGKFHPFYPVPELIDVFDRVRVDHPDLEFHLGGDKIWRTEHDEAYADALDDRLGRVPGLVWHGAMTRAAVANLLAAGGIALSVWDYRHGSHWNDLVVSTKLLDYCAAGVPVILNRTAAQESILGADYPLFVGDVREVEGLVRRLLAEPELYRAAAERCWTATRSFTYEAVHERLRPYLGVAPAAS
ncbi:MAG TPA: glycosyltransferase, partial [Candidatus Limnocylindrales bacterium]